MTASRYFLGNYSHPPLKKGLNKAVMNTVTAYQKRCPKILKSRRTYNNDYSMIQQQLTELPLLLSSDVIESLFDTTSTLLSAVLRPT